ncbi:MAG: citrate/2-methylcitrate synthase [Lachnospiraceae bacterium]|nr:citrate/2-methylcitrate synthase [Lachnospiraceae bacterium]
MAEENVVFDERKINKLVDKCVNNSSIDFELYKKYDVKRGLRDVSGAGVLTGLTEISEIVSHTMIDMDYVPCNGVLRYRGIDIKDLVKGFLQEDRFGFEETVYLLLFGELPTKRELSSFNRMLSSSRQLPPFFVRDIVLKAPSKDMMNTLQRSVLSLYAYDENPDDVSLQNVLRQCIELIARVPMLSVYGYKAHRHFNADHSLLIRNPKPGYSTAENILYTLRPNGKFTRFEAKILDLALVLHAEHGGGNNSTFTNHVVTSSGTDTYSAIAASISSLKGPKHGGANLKVCKMFEDIKEKVKDWSDEDAIRAYLERLVKKEEFDRCGLVYGIGHAVYSISDPRAEVFKEFVKKLSVEKGKEDEFNLYNAVERIAPEVIAKERKMYKGVSANVDFYSGFVYNMLELPQELFTPIFAVSRIAGWSAHRLEELINGGKIIRPAYKSIAKHVKYVDIENR